MNDNQTVAIRDTDESEFTFETSLAALEAAVHDLEDGQLGLTDALARYEASVKHLRHCYQLLEAAEQKIELLTGVADDGSAISQPFSEAGENAEGNLGRKRRPRPKPVNSAGQADVSQAAANDIDGSMAAT